MATTYTTFENFTSTHGLVGFGQCPDPHGDGLCRSASGKAILLSHKRGESWVPLSLCTFVDNGMYGWDLYLPYWFCSKEGLQPEIAHPI